MIIAFLIIRLDTLSEDALKKLLRQCATGRRQHRGHLLEQIECHAGISARELRNRGEDTVRRLDGTTAQSPVAVRERPLTNACHLCICELLQPHDAHTREQSVIHLEKGILRRRADQDETSILDVGEQHILLALVEPMDLIDEHDGATRIELPLLLRLFDDGTQIRDARGHRIEFLEHAMRVRGNHLGKRRLARARRPEEDHGRHLVRLHHVAQETSGTDGLLLPDKLLECTRPHPLRKRHKSRCAD